MSTGLIATICSLVAAFLYLLVFNNVVYVQSSNIQNGGNSNSTLSVIGNAETMVKPDKVTLTLSVETTNKTANAALITNSETMNNVLDALKSSGVKENETSTSSFNIFPNYNNTHEDFRPIESRDIISYTVTNSIIVDSMNLLNVPQWIDTAVQAGVNDVSSISFTLSDKKSELIKNDLLNQAITNAKNKADIAASALGLEVIGVRSIIIEGIDGIPVSSSQQSFFASEAVDSAAPRASPPPIIAGEQKVTSSVYITFLIN
jgi:uncharacterized protein